MQMLRSKVFIPLLFLQHVVTNLFLDKLLDEVGLLMKINHHLLCSLGVGHEKLNLLCWVTEKQGVYSKLTGAGGGGCAISLLRRTHSTLFVNDLQESIVMECGDVECFEAEVGGDGVTFHDQLPILLTK